MLSLLDRANLPRIGFAVIFFAFGLLNPNPLPAQERYPAVARISFVSGPVTYSRGDDPDEWDDAIENVPLTIGDRIYSPEGGRAEVQLSSGNFVRLAPRSYFTTLNLGDDIKQFYLGEGAASFNIKRLQTDEVIEIDTPNVSVTLDEPGTYRIAVDEDGNSRITVRRGRVMVAASGRQIAVENSEMRVYGIDSPQYEIVGLPGTDAFDRWASERDDRYERSYTDAYRYASDDIIGVEDLLEYGRWEQIPDYGYAWTPTRVAAGWVPFSDGRWFWQDPWGWTWISNQRWGWATSHYGRWTPYRSRWYWVPVRPRTRVRYVPAVVEFVRVRDHVGWFPLHPRDRYLPWWDRRDRRNITYVNRTYVTIVNQNTFISARPINRYIVRDSVIERDARSGRFASESLPIPNRTSLRVASETGGRRGFKPSVNVLNRAAVVRTAPPAPPPSFREKLPEIQKAQGKPIEPSQGLALVSAADKARPERVRIRPAAEEIRGKEFAPRNPAATSGPTPQPVTAARGKKLATRESVDSDLAEKAERAEKSPASQPAPATPPEQNKRTAGRPDAQTQERERQAQQQELERRKQEQQKEQQERKAQLQKQREQQHQEQSQQRQAQEQKQQELERRQAQQREERKAQKQQPAQDRRQEPQERQSPQQRLDELERKTQQREEERKSQVQQNRQEQERREQLRQQQLQERQAQQQRQQELERRGQEQERKAQAQQQQEQGRREQLKQQQVQERQAREQQRQQDLERRQQQQQQREQDRNAQLQRQEQARAQQLRQQQAQEQRQAQQQQRQQQLQRRQPEPQKEQERKVPPQQP
jgi:FecR protein